MIDEMHTIGLSINLKDVARSSYRTRFGNNSAIRQLHNLTDVIVLTLVRMKAAETTIAVIEGQTVVRSYPNSVLPVAEKL